MEKANDFPTAAPRPRRGVPGQEGDWKETLSGQEERGTSVGVSQTNQPIPNCNPFDMCELQVNTCNYWHASARAYRKKRATGSTRKALTRHRRMRLPPFLRLISTFVSKKSRRMTGSMTYVRLTESVTGRGHRTPRRLSHRIANAHFRYDATRP